MKMTFSLSKRNSLWMNLKIIKLVLITFFVVITTNSCKTDKKDDVSPYANQTQVAIYAVGFQESNNDQGVVIISILQTPDRQLIIENLAFRYNEKNIENVRALCEKFYRNLLNNSSSLSGYKNMEDYILQTFQSPKTFKNITKLRNENLYKLIDNQSFSLASLNEKSKNDDFLFSLLSSFIPSAMAQVNVNGLLTTYFGVLLGVFAGSVAALAVLGFGAELAFVGAVAVGYNYVTGQATSTYDIFPGFGPISQTVSTVTFGGGSLGNDFNKIYDPVREGLGGSNYSPSIPSPTTWEDLIDRFNKWRNDFFKKLPKINPFGGWGDPHLITSDGVSYDFQGKGEFVAVKSNTDNFEIQARQVDSDRWTAPGLVTVNTAIAINTGQNIISVYSNPNRLFVNKTERKLTDKISLNGNDKIVIENSSTITITSGLNDEIKINLRDSYLDYQVQLATSRQGKIAGLLGNFNGNSQDDLVSSKGEKIDINSYNSLYKTFGDSWRVTNSYFNYDAGKNTDSYTDRNYPRQIVSIESFSMAERTQAEQTCKRLGVINEPALSSCILDLAVTKNESFAVSALQIDESVNVSTSFSFTDFTSANIFKNGSASVIDKKLYLTKNQGFQDGSAFTQNKAIITNGFEMNFDFAMTELGGIADVDNKIGGDGIALVIHANSRVFNTKIYPSTGSRLGYAGIPKSLAIEFDSYKNDVNDRRLWLNTQGKSENSSVDNDTNIKPVIGNFPNFWDAKEHKVKITYTSKGNNLFKLLLYFDGSNTPSLTADDINLTQFIGADDSLVYFGFTATTAGANSNQIISNWSFKAL